MQSFSYKFDFKFHKFNKTIIDLEYKIGDKFNIYFFSGINYFKPYLNSEMNIRFS